tara:strand:- start:455 stop:1210 length:756 start_codon:yes stop_codon:yes gene_type:complete
MRVVLITQARLGSSRLPNKVLKKINNKTLLQIHIERIKKCKNINDICIATTINKEDLEICKIAKKLKVNYYKGSEKDVLDRYYKAAKKMDADLIVRVTSDCPLIDSKLIDEIIQKAIKKQLDYYSNVLVESFPDGQDVEVFKFDTLKRAWENAILLSDREHVTPFIKNNSTFKRGSLFTSDNYFSDINYNLVRLTVDEKCDYDVIKKIIDNLGDSLDWKSYADYYVNNKEINIINGKIKRNEGYKKSMKEI